MQVSEKVMEEFLQSSIQEFLEHFNATTSGKLLRNNCEFLYSDAFPFCSYFNHEDCNREMGDVNVIFKLFCCNLTHSNPRWSSHCDTHVDSKCDTYLEPCVVVVHVHALYTARLGVASSF